jgi:hypothetical protein
VFVLGTLAAWRVWKLAATDDILNWPRDRVAPKGTRRREFLECPYCAGWWAAALGTLGYYLVSDVALSWGTVFGWTVTTFAMSAIVVFLEVALDLTVAKKDRAEDD